MINNTAIKSLSTTSESILALIFLPKIPPPIPPAAITNISKMLTSGTVLVNTVKPIPNN